LIYFLLIIMTVLISLKQISKCEFVALANADHWESRKEQHGPPRKTQNLICYFKIPSINAKLIWSVDSKLNSWQPCPNFSPMWQIHMKNHFPNSARITNSGKFELPLPSDSRAPSTSVYINGAKIELATQLSSVWLSSIHYFSTVWNISQYSQQIERKEENTHVLISFNFLFPIPLGLIALVGAAQFIFSFLTD